MFELHRMTTAIILLLFSIAAYASASTDGHEDTFGASPDPHDLLSIEAISEGGHTTFVLTFFEEISAASNLNSTANVVGFIDIDVDQDPSTGAISQQSMFGPGKNSALGAEYYIDLFSEEFSPGLVEIIDSQRSIVVGQAPIHLLDNSLSVIVPLSSLGGDDGLFDFGAIVGDFVDMSDEAGPATSLLVPEPATTSVVVMLAITFLLPRKRLS